MQSHNAPLIIFAITSAIVLACVVLITSPVRAQDGQAAAPLPNDGLGNRVVIRFLTESEFPPFNFYDEDGVLTGFNIDLARAICLEANVTCDIKVQPWERLIPALKQGQGDAIIAAQRVTAKALRDVDFTARYFHTPGRFVARRRGRRINVSREDLVDRKIGVVANSRHEA